MKTLLLTLVLCVPMLTMAALAEEEGRYEARYDTTAHRMLRLESALPAGTPNAEFLDSLIDQARRGIQRKESYTRQDALDIFKTIDRVLIENGFVYEEGALTLSGTLTRQRAAQSVLDAIQREAVRRHVRAPTDRMFHLTDCTTNSLIFLAVGEVHELPVSLVLAPGHVFVRWTLGPRSHVNWETTSGSEWTDEAYRNRFEIDAGSITRGVFLEGLDRDGIEAFLLNLRGQAWAEARRYERAVTDYSRGLALHPRYSSVFCNRGIARSKLGRTGEALADYDACIALDPRDAKAYYNRGSEWEERRGDHARAMADYDKAIALKPTLALAWCARGKLWLKHEEVAKALADLERAVQLAPRFGDAYYNRARAHRRGGRIEAAIADLTKVIELEPERSDAWFGRGLYRSQADQLDGALSDLDRSIELNPGFSPAFYNRGRVYARKGRHERALVDLTKCLQLSPRDPQAYELRAHIYRQLGRASDAEADERRARELRN